MFKKENICLAFDVSGSLGGMFDSLKNNRTFDEILNTIKNKHPNSDIHIVLFDSKICMSHIMKAKSKETIYSLELEKTILGAGGTLVEPVFEYMKENHCKELHMITDGYFCINQEDIVGEMFCYITGKYGTNVPYAWNKIIPFEDHYQKQNIQTSNLKSCH